MNKLKFLSWFALTVFSATALAQVTQGPWTYMDYRTGCCDRNANLAISFDGLNNSHWAEVTGPWCDDDGVGFTVKNGKANKNSKNGVFSTYFIDQTLESYSRKVLTWTYKIGSRSKKHYSNTCLYGLQGTWQDINALTVDFTEEYSNKSGSDKLLAQFRNTSLSASGIFTDNYTKTFAFDNRSNASSTTKSWCLLLTHVVSSADPVDDMSEWGSFKHVSATWTTYYYKYVTFNANGGSGSMNVQTIENSGKLTANAFSRTGYTFDGWATSSTGSKAYDNQGDISATSGSKGNVTLYARWKANTYTVTFNKQDGTGGSASVTATYASNMPTATMPTRTGYTFQGYYTEANGAGTKYYNANGTSAKNWDKTAATTLYAYWTVNKYTVTFDKQNGTGGSNNVSATFDAAMPAATMPTRAAYIFEGYFDATTGGTKYYNADGTSAKNWNKAANTTLYARWTPITYTITYDLNGGELETANPATYNIETATFTLNNPARTDWIFNGWMGSNGDNPETSVSIATGSTGDKSYKADFYLACLVDLYNAIGTEVWTGYGAATGVISYSHGDDPLEFRAVFMGGTFTVDIPFRDFTSAQKTENQDGSVTYSLVANLPPVTGLATETLHITMKDGKITGLDSENAGIEMSKEQEISGWAALQEALNAGGVIKLAADVTAESTDAALTVPADKTAILELNGHTINRALTAPVANGSVIINNGVLAIMGDGQIKGGYTTGNGGGIVNNGTLTLYGGEITGNRAKGNGGGVYNSAVNTATEGFWMTGGLIHNNVGLDYPAIGGEVSFNSLAVVQIDAMGKEVSGKTAKAGMKKYDYIHPVMMDPYKFALLSELHAALGTEVWTGYGAATGVISYSRGDEPNEFKAVFMGGTYSVDLPFGDVISINKELNEDESYTYTMVTNVPPVTGLETETVQVTIKDGKITALASQNAGMEMSQEYDTPITDWASLKAAMEHGGVIKLAQDFVAEESDEALIVPEGKTVVLELNGHTLNRALTAPVENGSVIINNGTLAIMGNENSKIMGGNTTGNGGGILNNGTLTLYGGEITGNYASAGAGVYNNKVNTETEGFWMTGGLIDNNTSDSYPAIGGEVHFNTLAVIQINAEGKTASPAMVMQGLYNYYSYIQPVMPSMEDMSKPTILVNYLGFDSSVFDHEIAELNQHDAPVIEGFTFLRWEFKAGLLADGIKLQAVYKSNNEEAPAQVIVGEYTLVRPGNLNEYILQ